MRKAFERETEEEQVSLCVLCVLCCVCCVLCCVLCVGVVWRGELCA